MSSTRTYTLTTYTTHEGGAGCTISCTLTLSTDRADAAHGAVVVDDIRDALAEEFDRMRRALPGGAVESRASSCPDEARRLREWRATRG